jgi:hypothetical protein
MVIDIIFIAILFGVLIFADYETTDRYKHHDKLKLQLQGRSQNEYQYEYSDSDSDEYSDANEDGESKYDQ